MNNDIIAIAREASRYADIEFQRTWESGEGGSWQEFRDERFAALVRADEREACAKFFEEHWRETWTDEQVAEVIRARGQA
jgi:hypothetical protein